MRQMQRAHLAVPLAIALTAGQIGEPAAAAVSAYRAALDRLEHRGGATVAVVFDRALALNTPLTQPTRELESIEHLAPADFARLRSELRRMLINRDEIVFVRPDPRFFAGLAKQYGKADDVAFFAEYEATYPDGVWASYVQQQTDYSGCTDFGSGQLVARYAGWRSYRRRFPRSYVAAAAERLREIEQEVSGATCTCRDRDAFLQELRRFESSFPDSPIQAQVRRRIGDVEHGMPAVRFGCISG